MKHKKIFSLIALFSVFALLVPQITLAAWWNPFSWFDDWFFLRGLDGTEVQEMKSDTSFDDNTVSSPVGQQESGDIPNVEPQSPPIISESPDDEDTSFVAYNSAVIKSIEAKASPDGVLYSGERAFIRGTGLSGDLTITLGTIEPRYVSVTSVSDTYAEFVVPSYSQPVTVSVTVTNSSGQESNFYTAQVNVQNTQEPAVIESIEAKASPDGILYSGEKAYVRGMGLGGELTIKLGNIEPRYVYVTGISDTYAEFIVPSYSQKIHTSVVVINSSGEASNSYQVEVNSSQ